MLTTFLFSAVLRNEYIKIYIDPTYSRPYMETIKGDPNLKSDDRKSLLFKTEPPTSYLTVRIDGKNYKYFEGGKILQEPQNTGSSIVSEWEARGVRVKMEVRITEGPTTHRKDTAIFIFTVTNKDKKAHKVGLRLLLDTLLGRNDGAPFNVPGVGPLQHETEFKGDKVPFFWYAYDDLKKPTVRSQGTLRIEGYPNPSKVIFANWKRMFYKPWDYKINPSKPKDFRNEGVIPFAKGKADTAVAIYWNEKKIQPQQSFSVATLYGLYGALLATSDAFALTASHLKKPDGSIIVTSDAQNIAKLPIQGVKYGIKTSPNLKIIEGKNPINVGDMKPEQKAQGSWTLKITGGGKAWYTVYIGGKLLGEKYVEANITQNLGEVEGYDVSWVYKYIEMSENNLKQLQPLQESLEKTIATGADYSKSQERTDMNRVNASRRRLQNIVSQFEKEAKGKGF